MKDLNKTGCTIGGGIFVPILTIVFFLAKIFGYIDWSWWWVFSPIWINVGLIVVIMLIWLLFTCLSILLDPYSKYKL